MDPLTHSLAGLSIAQALTPDAPTWAVVGTSLLAANAPDVDFLARVKGAEAYFATHHGLTHSIPIAAALGGAAGGILGALAGAASVPGLVLLGVVVSVVHLGLDWITPWGGPLLWPVRRRRLDLAVVPFYDPVITVLLLAATVSAWRHPDVGGLLVAAAWLLIAAYLLGRVGLMRKAAALVREMSPDPTGMKVYAPPLGVHFSTWSVVGAAGSVYRTWRVDLRRGEAVPTGEHIPAREEDFRALEASRALRCLRRQYDFIAVETSDRDGREVRRWYSASTLPDADYRLEALTSTDAAGNLVRDELVVDIRGPYEVLIENVWRRITGTPRR